MIGATAFWRPGVDAGAGMKIAILDDGIDQTHPFFSPRGYAMPAGFPKGQTAYTTAKVIVARAFPPPGLTWPDGRLPFDPATRPSTRRTSRASPRATRARSRAACASPASRRARTSATTRC